MYTNTDVLLNKMTEIESIAENNLVHVIAINKILPKKMPDKFTCKEDFKFEIKGYKTIPNYNGRGIIMFIKKGIDYEHSTEFDEIFKCSILIKIKSVTETIVLSLVYRSPGSTEEENSNLLKYVNILSKTFNSPNNKLILIGDFNLPTINWELECTVHEHEDKGKHMDSRFLNCIQENFLFQTVDENTHHRGEQNPTLIDLVLTSNTENIQNLTLSSPLGNSHHSVITFSIPFGDIISNSNNTSVKFIYDKGDYNNMRQYLETIDWNNILVDSDNVEVWKSNIENVISKAQQDFIPTKSFKNSPHKSKRTLAAPESLLKKTRDKRKAFKYFKKYPTTNNYNQYCTLRNIANTEAKNLKKLKERTIAKDIKTNPKNLYRYISSKTKPMEDISHLIDDQGNLTKNDKEKCEVLNEFFSSVFVNEGDGPVLTFTSNFKTELTTITINDENMQKALNNLNSSKSPGPDQVHPRVLKELAEQLSHPLRLLFDKTLRDGKIPESWKVAEVKPIFKKGKKSSPGNYRPVSLTSIICKVFESFIRDALCEHITNNNLLSVDQFGFCRGRSCVSQLLVTVEEWFSSLDKSIPVDAAYLDFRKAFDSVPHKRLVSKLYGYGVRGPVLDWVTDFLTNRSQYVNVNNSCSDRVPVTSGVPQGSVLGPSLFVYYINDLPDVSTTPLKIFADDTKVYVPLHSDIDQANLQNSINQLVDWSEKWMIRFNSEKCKILHLGKNNPKYNYVIKEGDKLSTLEETKCEKDLGVNIDPELNFNTHIKLTIKKARRISGMILRNITYKSKSILIPLYKALIRPILEYGNAVWCPYLKKDINEIEKVQRHFTKKIHKTKNLDYEVRLRVQKLPSLEFRRLRGDLIEVFKILKAKYDPLTTNSLLTRQETVLRSNKFKLQKNRVNTKQYLKFFSNRVINIWNKLPNHIVVTDDLNKFKNRIDDHLSDLMFSTNLHIG